MGSILRPLSFIASQQDPEGDGSLRIGGFRTRKSTTPRPVSEYQAFTPGYFNAFPNSSSSQLPNALSASSPSVSHDPILPIPGPQVEQEGRESLPGYSCSLKAESVFQRKMEMTSPFSKAPTRWWSRVFVVLKGTLLCIHKVRDPGLFSKLDLDYKGTPDRPLGCTAGPLLRSYTLQHAEVGIAVDYRKTDFVPRAMFLKLLCHGSAEERMLYQKTKHFVIRVRVEADQFLLSCSTVQTFLYWLECLGAAIDLSPPLDERRLPQHRTIPVRRRRRNHGNLGSGEADCVQPPRPLLLEDTPTTGNDGSGHVEIVTFDPMPSDYPADGRPHSIAGQAVIGGARDARRQPKSTESSSPGKRKWRWSLNSVNSVPARTEDYASATLHRSNSITSFRAAVAEAGWPTARPGRSVAQQLVDAYDRATEPLPRRLLQPDGEQVRDERLDASLRMVAAEDKWCPAHNWSYARHVQYARRCMTNLMSNAPRQSEFIVKDGRKWKIRWDLGQLVSCEPETLPGYEDAMESRTPPKPEVVPEIEPRAILCL